jgi:hypothetical protein
MKGGIAEMSGNPPFLLEKRAISLKRIGLYFNKGIQI